MGADRFPEERQLELIRSWPENDYPGLMQYVESLWRGWKQPRNPFNHDIAAMLYQVSTRGRAGNEAIITALEANRSFWEQCWVSYRVGGHYEFKVKVTAHRISTPERGEATSRRSD